MENDEGDFDWMNDEQRLLDIQQNPIREPIKSIRGYFIFINQHQYIDKILVEDISRENPTKHGIQKGGKPPNFEGRSPIVDAPIDTNFRLSFSKVLRLTQSKKYTTSNTKYIFKEACLFHVDLEAEHVQGFVNESDDGIGLGSVDKRFFRVLPATEDIVIPPSMFMFHSVNALYFFFQEVPLKRMSGPKSILKMENHKEMLHNTTKKRVSLKENPVFHVRDHQTKKAFSRINSRGTRKHISVKNIDI